MNTSQYSYAKLGLIMDRELCNSSICNNICYIKLPFSKKGLEYVVFKDLNRNTNKRCVDCHAAMYCVTWKNSVK